MLHTMLHLYISFKTVFRSIPVAAVASKKRVSVSSSLETTLTSTSHNSISETRVHILSGETEFNSLSDSVCPLKL